MKTPPPAPRIRVALLDDDVVDRLQVRRLMANDDTLTLVAEGAAIAEVDRLIADADILLLDHHLPDGDGVQVLRRLRRDQHIPVVALTGSRDDQVAVALLKAGADDYLSKDHLTAERLCHTLRATVQAAQDRAHALRADTALRDLAAVAETSDRDCLPALVQAIGTAWAAQGCGCFHLGDGTNSTIAASWGDITALQTLATPTTPLMQRQGTITTLLLCDENGQRRGFLAVDAVVEPHPRALAVLRVAGARAVAAWERAEHRAQLERAWRLERAVATTARELLTGSGSRRDPTLALRAMLDGFEADRVAFLAADQDGLALTHQQTRGGCAPTTWRQIAWRPRLRRWQTELTDGAPVTGLVDQLTGDEGQVFNDDALVSFVLIPILRGEHLLAVLRLDSGHAAHWTRDRIRALRHAAQLIQVWWQLNHSLRFVQS